MKELNTMTKQDKKKVARRAALIRGQLLKEGSAYFKVREIIQMKRQNFVISTFQVTINNCHNDI